MKRKLAIIFGLFGGWADPITGERLLTSRARTIPNLDLGASPYNWNDSQAIYDFLKDADWRGFIGDSLGASNPLEYLAVLPKIDFAAGFQPSVYASDAHNGVITVPRCIKLAHCIRDPIWFDTGGLGYARWEAEDPKKTTLLTTEHRGAHPDDFGYSQDLIFNQLKGLLHV